MNGCSLLFVGGDFERKGGPLLLEQHARAAWRALRAARRDAGRASRPSPTSTSTTDSARTVRELLELFEQADVFVLPSLGECLAVVLMEATAAGLPVITTDIAALGEAVRPGETGLLIPPADGRRLGDALAALADDPVLRRQMGRGGAELARQKFDANRNNAALLDLTQEVARARRAERKVA